MNSDRQKLLQKCVGPETTVRDAIYRLENGREKILMVLNADGILVGTIADGDIRRAVINGAELDDSIAVCAHSMPVTVLEGTSMESVIALMYARTVREIPVVDANGHPIDIHMLDELLDQRRRDNVAFILAGGYGERLRPLTETVPKPLVEVGGKPILESLILKLIAHGFHNFVISVNYKKEMIKDYFGDGSKYGIRIEYVEEPSPMGTIGSISLIKERPAEPVLVINSDIITNLNFGKMLKFHESEKASLTIGTVPHDYQVPFGVLKINEGFRVESVIEKPVLSHKISGGVYAIEPDILDRIPVDAHLDMPDLISLLIAQGDTVVGYDISEYWTDIGDALQVARAEGSVKLWSD